jgi:hypothetical protein
MKKGFMLVFAEEAGFVEDVMIYFSWSISKI